MTPRGVLEVKIIAIQTCFLVALFCLTPFLLGKVLIWKYDGRKLAQLSAADLCDSTSLLLETLVSEYPTLFAWDSERESQTLTAEEIRLVQHVLSTTIAILSHLIHKHQSAFSDVTGVSLMAKDGAASQSQVIDLTGIEGGGRPDRAPPRRTKSLKLNVISKSQPS